MIERVSKSPRSTGEGGTDTWNDGRGHPVTMDINKLVTNKREEEEEEGKESKI